jgi:hypothetical protein
MIGTRAPWFASKRDLLNCEDTMQWIKERYKLIGWTYSYDSEWITHFTRLIAGTGRKSIDKVKYCPNVHQKVYIHKREMLISSANLVSPTIQNVSIIIRDPVLINYMRITFNLQWRKL